MKALTVCQPYASMIVNGEKPIENRTRPTFYRGLIYVHAGKSREWVDAIELMRTDISVLPVNRMAFGAVVGIARIIDCCRVQDIQAGRKHPELRYNAHLHGPWCWILSGAASIGPWPWKGAQGLFEIDSGALSCLANRILGIFP